jgi:hypothetical protein
MRAAPWLLVLAVGCGPTQVDCVLALDPLIDPTSPTSLQIAVGGDESYDGTIDLPPQGFPTDGARFVYHPAISSGALDFYFAVSNDGFATKLGDASQTGLQLKPHEAVRLELTLRICPMTGCN